MSSYLSTTAYRGGSTGIRSLLGHEELVWFPVALTGLFSNTPRFSED